MSHPRTEAGASGERLALDFATGSIPMAHYSADMDELSALARSAIGVVQRELREAQQMLWAVVSAAGGSVEIPEAVLDDMRGGESVGVLRFIDRRSILVTAETSQKQKQNPSSRDEINP